MNAARAMRFAATAALLASAAGAQAQVSIAPRVSACFDNGTQQQSVARRAGRQGIDRLIEDVNAQLRPALGPNGGFALDEGEIVSGGGQIFYPLFGASLTFGVGAQDQLTLTELYGDGSGTLSAVAMNRATGGQQSPWRQGDLAFDVYLAGMPRFPAP